MRTADLEGLQTARKVRTAVKAKAKKPKQAKNKAPAATPVASGSTQPANTASRAQPKKVATKEEKEASGEEHAAPQAQVAKGKKVAAKQEEHAKASKAVKNALKRGRTQEDVGDNNDDGDDARDAEPPSEDDPASEGEAAAMAKKEEEVRMKKRAHARYMRFSRSLKRSLATRVMNNTLE